jgi:hypothetical protein
MPSDEPVAEPAPPQAVEAASPDSPARAPVPGRLRRLPLRLGRRRWTMAAAGVVVAALVAGLVVWSPWTPNPPSAVRVTASTATTAEITWAASGGIASPDRYLVLRDGQQVGSVQASATSWTDHGLSPGTTYDYSVVAAGWLQSGPSPAATVTTLAPSPVGLTITHVTYNTATLRWWPPRNAPVPDLYEIYNGPVLVDTIEGTVTSYTDTHQEPGNLFQYSVTAQWGNDKSAPSAQALGEVLEPPLSGTVPVKVVTTSVPGNGASLSVGYQWDDYWTFSATCAGDGCQISAGPDIEWTKGEPYYAYPVTLSGSGRTYSGTAQESRETRCGSDWTTDTLTLTVTATSVVKGAWRAWTGTMVLTAAPAANGCPQATWKFAVTTAS